MSTENLIPLAVVTTSKEFARRLYSREQVRKIFGGCSRHTVWRMEKRGELRSVRLSPGKTQARAFYDADAVDALVLQKLEQSA